MALQQPRDGEAEDEARRGAMFAIVTSATVTMKATSARAAAGMIGLAMPSRRCAGCTIPHGLANERGAPRTPTPIRTVQGKLRIASWGAKRTVRQWP